MLDDPMALSGVICGPIHAQLRTAQLVLANLAQLRTLQRDDEVVSV